MPTDAELDRDAQTVNYEIWMLMEASERLGSRLTLPTDEIARRAVLESWVLHLRALLEFFRTGTREPDDVRAEDYFAVGSAEVARIQALAPARGSWEESRRKEMRKLLAHIVQDRSRFNSDWNARDLAAVTDRLQTFFEALAPDRRAWFPRASRWFASSP